MTKPSLTLQKLTSTHPGCDVATLTMLTKLTGTKIIHTKICWLCKISDTTG